MMNSKRFLRNSAIAAVLSVGALLAMPLSAQADDTTTTTTTNADCVAQVKAAQAQGSTQSTDVCNRTIKTTIGPETDVSAKDIAAAKTTMSTADYNALVAAAKAGKVRGKPYSRDLIAITDQERLSGYFYYDGSRAWVTHSYRSHVGSETCTIIYSTAYTVEKRVCSDTGSNSTRTLTAIWHFTLIGPAPINFDDGVSLQVKANGSIV